MECILLSALQKGGARTQICKKFYEICSLHIKELFKAKKSKIKNLLIFYQKTPSSRLIVITKTYYLYLDVFNSTTYRYMR